MAELGPTANDLVLQCNVERSHSGLVYNLVRPAEASGARALLYAAAGLGRQCYAVRRPTYLQ